MTKLRKELKHTANIREVYTLSIGKVMKRSEGSEKYSPLNVMQDNFDSYIKYEKRRRQKLLHLSAYIIPAVTSLWFERHLRTYKWYKFLLARVTYYTFHITCTRLYLRHNKPRCHEYSIVLIIHTKHWVVELWAKIKCRYAHWILTLTLTLLKLISRRVRKIAKSNF